MSRCAWPLRDTTCALPYEHDGPCLDWNGVLAERIQMAATYGVCPRCGSPREGTTQQNPSGTRVWYDIACPRCSHNESRPKGWPDYCHRCGADWTHIGFDHADGFSCDSCGGCDSDE